MTLTSKVLLAELNDRYPNAEEGYDTYILFMNKILTRMVELESLINEKIDREDLRVYLSTSGLIDAAAEDE